MKESIVKPSKPFKYIIISYLADSCMDKTYFYITTTAEWFVTIGERDQLLSKHSISDRYRSNIRTLLLFKYEVVLDEALRKQYKIYPVKDNEIRIPYFLSREDAQFFLDDFIPRYELIYRLKG